MYTVQPDWNSTAFDRIWNMAEQEYNTNDNFFQNYFFEKFDIVVRPNADGFFQWIDFKSKEHYVLFMMEWG